MHICVTDNSLSPSWCQAIICTNAGLLLIRPLGTKFSEISIDIYQNALENVVCKMAAIFIGLNVLRDELRLWPEANTRLKHKHIVLILTNIKCQRTLYYNDTYEHLIYFMHLSAYGCSFIYYI